MRAAGVPATQSTKQRHGIASKIRPIVSCAPFVPHISSKDGRRRSSDTSTIAVLSGFQGLTTPGVACGFTQAWQTPGTHLALAAMAAVALGSAVIRSGNSMVGTAGGTHKDIFLGGRGGYGQYDGASTSASAYSSSREFSNPRSYSVDGPGRCGDLRV